jgi:hypothetical protein
VPPPLFSSSFVPAQCKWVVQKCVKLNFSSFFFYFFFQNCDAYLNSGKYHTCYKHVHDKIFIKYDLRYYNGIQSDMRIARIFTTDYSKVNTHYLSHISKAPTAVPRRLLDTIPNSSNHLISTWVIQCKHRKLIETYVSSSSRTVRRGRHFDPMVTQRSQPRKLWTGPCVWCSTAGSS